MIAEDDTHLVYVPLEKLAEPPDGIIEHFVDHWWAVHPERGALLYRADKRARPVPQGNTNRRIAEALGAKLYPWASVELIPHAYLRVDLGWYR